MDHRKHRLPSQKVMTALPANQVENQEEMMIMTISHQETILGNELLKKNPSHREVAITQQRRPWKT